MSMPPELEAALDAIAADGRPRTRRELETLLAAEVARYNARPQAGLGGLSPEAMARLLHTDWSEPTGALYVAEDLQESELSDVPFLHDARLLLGYVAAHEPVKETAAHFLPRAAMLELIPRLRVPRYPGLPTQLPPPRAPREADFPWIEIVRHTAMFAGLLVRSRGLRMTKRGRALLAPANCGELYALLFRTLFQQVDLRFIYGGEHHGLQRTIAYSLYRLRDTARQWATGQQIAGVAWLPEAMDPPSRLDLELGDARHRVFEHRVLIVLEQFGLVERRYGPDDRWGHHAEYRLTGLFDRVLQFAVGQRPMLVR